MEFRWGFGPIMRVGLWSHEGKSGSKKRKILPHLFPGSHIHFHKTAPKIIGRAHIAKVKFRANVYDQTWLHSMYS